MPTIYAVFRNGIYRHECGGLFSTLALASAAAVSLRDGEPDSYHYYNVIPFELDVVTSRIASSKPRFKLGTLDEPEQALDVGQQAND